MTESKSELIEKLLKALSNAKEVGDRSREGRICCNIGVAYQRLGKFREATEYHNKDLSIAKEVGDKAGEGRACCNLGNVYTLLGKFQEAINCHTEHLSISKQLGDKTREGQSYGNLGNALLCLGKFRDALEYFQKRLTIAKEVGDIPGEGRAYGSLGNAYQSLGSFQEAIEYHQKNLSIAKQLGDRVGEGRSRCNLGNACLGLGRFREAIEHHTKHLSISKEVGDRASEGSAYGNLGNAYDGLGNFQEAIEYHEKRLTIAKELRQRAAEGRAYGNLANAYSSLGQVKKVIVYLEKQLSIAKELSDVAEEGRAYSNLGSYYKGQGNFQQAVEYHNKDLTIAKTIGDKAAEGRAYCNLGISFRCIGKFLEAIKSHESYLFIAKEVGDIDGEGRAYGSLANVYECLGNFQEAIEYHKKCLSIAKKVGNRPQEGKCYGNLGIAYDMLGQFEEAVNHHQRRLSIAEELGDKPGQGQAYGNLGNVYQGLGDFQAAIEYHKKHLSSAKEFGDRAREGQAHANLGIAYQSLKEFEKAIECYNEDLSTAKEVGDSVGEGRAYGNLGDVYDSLGNFQKASECYRDSVKLLDILRASLESEDVWKISFRHLYRDNYSALWRTLIKLENIDEALCAAEQGRAQALIDSLAIQYGLTKGLPASIDPKETISYITNEFPTQAVFVGLEHKRISFWVMGKGNKIEFRQKEIGAGRAKEDSLAVLMESTFKQLGAGVGVRCENRTLDEDELSTDLPSHKAGDEEQSESSHSTVESLQPLYDVMIGPIADLCQGDELIIVPDGPLCLAPLPALSESIRIRTVPSLTGLKLITDSRLESHNKTGVLLVGDPCLQKVQKPKFKQLKYAKEEVEMIGKILNVSPLTGTEATKDEVLKRIKSVALVHIAAHGRKETGEIALAPNPGWEENQDKRLKSKNKGPREEDYILKISDVQEVRLRARLVVLSCCHSGRGELKSEGVVGIARAFLAAGARSVLVSLWAISDMATLAFMKSFYQHLSEGRSASVALHNAMKSLRESETFSAAKYWAPFVLIGDDVTLELGEKTPCKYNFLCYFKQLTFS